MTLICIITMLKKLTRRRRRRSQTKDTAITMPVSEPSYPPQLSEQQLSTLIANIRDWQFAHGSLLKAPPVSGNLSARPIGVTLFPSLYPKECFYEARSLQVLYNELYAAVAEDEEWLYGALKEYDSKALIFEDMRVETLRPRTV